MIILRVKELSVTKPSCYMAYIMAENIAGLVSDQQSRVIASRGWHGNDSDQSDSWWKPRSL